MFVLTFFIIFSCAIVADSDELETIRMALSSTSVKMVDQKIEDLTDLQVSKVLSELIAIVDSSRHPVAWTAMNRLTRTEIKRPSEQVMAIECFVKQLDHPEHAYRIAAIDGLIHLGPIAIDQVNSLLESPSILQRSAAVVILDRLNALSTDQLTALMQDPSSRIRYAALEATKRNHNSVDAILSLVEDEETAIALKAMSILSRNFRQIEDPSKVVAVLSKALGREVLKKDACIALARLGKKSQSAIPAIVRASPDERIGDFGFDDVGDVVLNHIGPADIGALDELIELLGSENLTTRTLAAKAISKLGPSASKSAVKLLEVAEQDLRLLDEQEKQSEDNDNHRQVRPNYDASVDACIVAHYRVSQDFDVLIHFLEKDNVFIPVSDCFADENSGNPDKQNRDRLANRLMVAFLERPKSKSSLEAIARIADLVQPDEALSLRLISALEFASVVEQKTLAVILAGCLKTNSPQREARMCQLVESEVLSLTNFIAVARRLQFRSQATLELLEKGLQERNEYSTSGLVSAWMELSPYQKKATKVLVNDSHCSRRAICESIIDTGIYNELIVDFLGDVLSDSDYWSKFCAIQALGKGKVHSKSQSMRLSSLLAETILISKQKTRELELALRIALFQIERKPDILNPVFADLNGMDANIRRHRLRLIAELGPDALPWSDEVLEELERVIDTKEADLREDGKEYESWMEFALRTTSERARNRVVELQNSEDALVSGSAKVVMHRFKLSRQ